MRKHMKMQKVLVEIIGALLLVMLLGILAGVISAGYTRRQAENSVASAADYYSTQLDTLFADINDYLGEEVFSNNDAVLLSYSTDPLLTIPAAQNLNEKLEFYRTKLGGDFHFFIYYPDIQYFVSSERGDLDIKEYQKLRNAVAEGIMKDYQQRQIKAVQKWSVMEIAGKYYALNYVLTENRYACCFIDMEKLADTVNVIPLGEENLVFFISQEGNLYDGIEELQEMNLIYHEGQGETHLLKTEFGSRSGYIHRSLNYAEFGLDVVMENNSQLLITMFMQVSIGLVFIVGILAAISILYRMKKKIINPLRYFSENLAKIQEGNAELYFDDVELEELQEANQLFEKILGQMKEMKIHMYEQTLENQKLELDYMKLQIQPHFYINCMSLIYNMACMGDDDTIQQLSACVSDYFRYIFRKNSQYVSITEELRHITNYLNIYKIRYHNRLLYEVTQQGDLDDVVIPPLLLHTFVENSVKYGKAQNQTSLIRLSAERIEISGVEFVAICVEDNGPGFPETVLEELVQNQEIVTEKGTRIGIMNCVKRLRLLYGDKAKVNFYNKEEGGALVKLCIPIRGDRKEGERE